MEEAFGRWKLQIHREGRVLEDFTGPLPRRSLLGYLFRSRRPDDEAILAPKQAWEMASHFDQGLSKARPFGQMNMTDGSVWWGVLTSSRKEPPTVPFETIDLSAIKPPEPGWATFMPGGWRAEMKPAMDAPAWQFYLEEWAGGH